MYRKSITDIEILFCRQPVTDARHLSCLILDIIFLHGEDVPKMADRPAEAAACRDIEGLRNNPDHNRRAKFWKYIASRPVFSLSTLE